MAAFLGIQAESLPENTHRLVDILQPVCPRRVVLPINDVLLEPAKVLWSTPTLVLPAACAWKSATLF